jgi:hypothetical protein
MCVKEKEKRITFMRRDAEKNDFVRFFFLTSEHFFVIKQVRLARIERKPIPSLVLFSYATIF